MAARTAKRTEKAAGASLPRRTSNITNVPTSTSCNVGKIGVDSSPYRRNHPWDGALPARTEGMTVMRARPLYDIVALLARIGIGTVFIAHGWQKVQVGITQTSDQFIAWDMPFPTAAAVYAT